MVAVTAGRKLVDRVEHLTEQTFTSRTKLMAYYKIKEISEMSTEQATHAIVILEKRLRGQQV